MRQVAATIIAVFVSGLTLRLMSQGKFGPNAAHLADEVIQGFGGPRVQ